MFTPQLSLLTVGVARRFPGVTPRTRGFCSGRAAPFVWAATPPPQSAPSLRLERGPRPSAETPRDRLLARCRRSPHLHAAFCVRPATCFDGLRGASGKRGHARADRGSPGISLAGTPCGSLGGGAGGGKVVNCGS